MYRKRTEVYCRRDSSGFAYNLCRLKRLPRMKLQTQKNPCIGYNLHSITSCKRGVIHPTRKLNAQFVAVDSETPFARTANGMIFVLHCQWHIRKRNSQYLPPGGRARE